MRGVVSRLSLRHSVGGVTKPHAPEPPSKRGSPRSESHCGATRGEPVRIVAGDRRIEVAERLVEIAGLAEKHGQLHGWPVRVPGTSSGEFLAGAYLKRGISTATPSYHERRLPCASHLLCAGSGNERRKTA